MSVVRIKRGDTIRWACTWRTGGVPVDLTGYTLESEVRAVSGLALATALTVTLGNQGSAPGTFSLYLADSSAFIGDRYVVDIRATEPDGDSFATESFSLVVSDPVTTR